MAKINRKLWEEAKNLESEIYWKFRFSHKPSYEPTDQEPEGLRKSAQKFEDAGDLGNAYRVYRQVARMVYAGTEEDKKQCRRLEKMLFE